MEYKTKGKEGTNAKGQKKETKLGKVNKKRGNDGGHPEKEKNDKADDISNNFPNFSVLNQEEKLAFFEALSAARKNIEKRGLPTRERFGTVHDEYLQYFAQDDKGDRVQKKPESAPSAKPSQSPVLNRKSPKESKLTTPELPKQRVPKTPEPVSPPKKTPKPPRENPRPESEPKDFCETVIKRDTDQMIQMYLNKKKRIEEQWKKSSQVIKSPPAAAKPKNREARPPSGRAVSRKEDPKAKTPLKPADTSNTPQFQALNPKERKELFNVLKEAHPNIIFKNPPRKDDILTLDEVLKPYKGGGGKATTPCPVTQGKQQKNLRVKVTLTSGDNKRLCRTKSQVLNDSAKEGSGGKSKSLESVVCPDTPHGKQSKIPILRKTPQERNERSDIKRETQPAKKIACEDLGCDGAPRAAEAKKTEAPVKEKTLTIKEEPESKEEEKMVAKEKKKKKKEKKKDKEAEQVSDECEENMGNSEQNLAKTKAELKKVRKDKERIRKEKLLAEAARKEKELLRKKKKQEWRKRHQRKESLKKNAGKDEDCMELKVVGVRIPRAECLKEEKKEHIEEKKSECENEELTTTKTNQENEDKCEDEKSAKMHMNEEKEDKCEDEKSAKMHKNEEKECNCEDEKSAKMHMSQENEDKCEEKKSVMMLMSQEKEDESEDEIPGGKQSQERDWVQKEQEEEDKGEKSEESVSSTEEKCPCQQLLERQEEAHQQPASESSCEKRPEPEHHRMFSSQTYSEHVVKTATQSTRSLAGVSLVEKRPEETWQAQEMAPTFTTGKVIVVDDNVIKRIKDLIHYLEKKVNPKDNLQSEYVRLVLNYTEYLTKVTESLILAKKPKKGQQVHSTYATPEVHLKFEDKGDEAPREDRKKGHVQHSISEDEFQRQTLPGPSGIEKKEDARRKKSYHDFGKSSDSESSSNSEEENLTLTPAAFKKTEIPMTKIRLLQDLLKGRAKFTEGSIGDFKIVHVPEGEYVPPEKTQKEEAKEISEADADEGQKGVGMKFLRNLAKLCNCGKKQIEDDAILENLRGEAVRVDTAEAKKDPASATINDSTMEVLKAAERKKIIEKYLKREQS